MQISFSKISMFAPLSDILWNQTWIESVSRGLHWIFKCWRIMAYLQRKTDIRKYSYLCLWRIKASLKSNINFVSDYTHVAKRSKVAAFSRSRPKRPGSMRGRLCALAKNSRAHENQKNLLIHQQESERRFDSMAEVTHFYKRSWSFRSAKHRKGSGWDRMRHTRAQHSLLWRKVRWERDERYFSSSAYSKCIPILDRLSIMLLFHSNRITNSVRNSRTKYW